MKLSLLVVQTATFVLLGAWFCASGELRLGVAQLLLAGVNVAVYA